MNMKRKNLGVLVLGSLVFVSGCSPQAVAERLSTAQVCTESVSILGDMREIVLLATTNPVGYATYAEELSVLVAEFSALEPLNAELNASHEQIVTGIETIVATLRDPSAASLGKLPTNIADTQIGLLDFAEACRG